MTKEMENDLKEVYKDAMDYGLPYFTVQEWNENHGEVQWNMGEFEGFYIADGFIQVR